MKKLYSEKKLKKIREKINDKKGKESLGIKIPESWSAELEKYSRIVEEPIKDFLLKKYEKKGKEGFYICESKKQINGKNIRIAFTQEPLRFLLGKEVNEESNEGYYFEKFLPKEDGKIILKKTKNPSVIVPGQFKIQLTREKIGKEELFVFRFRVFFLNGNGFADSSYFIKKYSWKYIEGSDYYMSDFEKLFCDTIIHKQYVNASIEKLAKYLEKEGAVNHARRLRYRAETHDNSKIGYTGNLPEDDRRKKKEDYDDELHALSRIINSRYLMRDVDRELCTIEKEAIQLHWKNNSHHPEHFESVLDMSTLDIMEMCCDWHARSVQWGTDLLAYAKNSQDNRFHFPEWMYQEVLYYLNILLE